MIKNYLLLFARNLRRQKLFSFINLFGLTLSLASTLLIYLYVQHELSFDRFHKEADRIYRVNQTFIWGEGSNAQFASTGPGVATALQAELPELELMTSIHTPGTFIVSYQNPAKDVITFEEERVLAADTNFFKMFNFPLIDGDAETVLRPAHAIVMTRSTAKKYFGTENPIGKMVQLGGLGSGEAPTTYEVTGVCEDNPDNSYLKYDMLLSMNSFPHIRRLNWSWIWTQLETYVRFVPGNDIANTRVKLDKIPKKYAEETLRRAMNTTYDEYTKKSGKKWELYLQPMTEIHLPKNVVLNRISDSGNIKIIYSFIGAALFIVLLSCVNFMNLSMAQFTRRIKEASVRKIMGLGRAQLGLGYFIEALSFCLAATLLALGSAQLFLPGFNYITGKTLSLNLVDNPILILVIGGLALFMATVSSLYPAIFLSAFHPVEAIKGKFKKGREGMFFRNSLVVFQFCASIVLIVCTAVVFQQLNYVSKKDIGFNKENLIVIRHLEQMKDRETFGEVMQGIPGVVSSARSTSVPPKLWGGDKFSAEGMNNETFSLNFTTADQQYVPTLDIRLKYGRNFSVSNPADADRVILNEAAIRKIGWKMDSTVIGKHLEYNDARIEVVGVVSDFNYWSLATPIEPMGIFNIKGKVQDNPREYATLRIQVQDGNDWESIIDKIRTQWKQHAPDQPFEYEFVDQAFAETFKSHQQFGKVLTVMASLAIIIACLGLLGIIIYSLEQRSKEIGIRKISGASVWNILTMVSGGYARLIFIAFLLGAPISYWLMKNWLEDFAYKVIPSVWIFTAAGLGILTLAIAITSYHSIKAALMNPVDVLRDE